MNTNNPQNETMKAERIHSFGGPEVLQLEEVLRPRPKQNELLVRVRAAGVNPLDWKIREGVLGEVALPSVVGSDFSGVVEALGPGVQGFKPGDEVFGDVADESGSYAEYALAPVTQVARKPGELDDVQAAALPVASLTAWQALFDTAQLQKGQKVLVHAAAGGVGGFAVQLANWKGAHVVGTASANNLEYVRRLGAEEVINYRATRFEEVLQAMDVVFDTIGGETQERSWSVLKRGGILVSIVQPPSQERATAQGVRASFMRADLARADQLTQIAELVASGKLKVNVEAVLPLNEARKAHEMSQTGHTRGKIVLRVE